MKSEIQSSDRGAIDHLASRDSTLASFQPLEISNLPKENEQFTDEGFKRKLKVSLDKAKAKAKASEAKTRRKQ